MGRSLNKITRVAVLTIFLAGLSLMSAPNALADGTVHINLTTPIGGPTPCTGEVISLEGPLTVSYHINQNGNGAPLYSFTFKDHATGTGDQGNQWLIRFEGSSKFAAPSMERDGFQAFIFPFHGMAVSKGSAPNFKVGGDVFLLFFNGEFVGSSLDLDEFTCVGGN
jgi:hypothetical protein